MRGASIAVLALLAAGAPAATQPAPPAAGSPETVFHVAWDPPNKPTRVEFDGGAPFVENGSEHVGRRPQPNTWLTSDLAVVHAPDEFPLRIVTQAGQPPVRLRVVKAHYAQCTPADVLDIWSRRPATVNARIALMMEARRLLTSGLCPASVRWKLAKRYFDTSCALAQDLNNPIDLSPDARRLYLEHARTEAQRREAETCGAQMQQDAIKRLLSEARAAADGQDPARYGRAYDELLAHAGDPRWEDGYAALQLDADTLKTRHADGIYARQLAAAEAGETEAALALNAELQSLSETDDYAPALSRVGITPDKLDRDRAYISSRSQ